MSGGRDPHRLVPHQRAPRTRARARWRAAHAALLRCKVHEHPGGKPVAGSWCVVCTRNEAVLRFMRVHGERGRERERERDRDRERETETDRQTDTHTHTHRYTQIHTDTHRHTQTDTPSHFVFPLPIMLCSATGTSGCCAVCTQSTTHGVGDCFTGPLAPAVVLALCTTHGW